MESLFIEMSMLFLSLPSYSGGRRWGRCDVQFHPVWGKHSSWGTRALAPTLVSNIKITFPDTVTKN